MRGLLALACRAFPRDHRARRSDEVVDTALLAADGSAWRAAREALSLVVAGFRERLHATEDVCSERRRGLAGVFAVVNLAVALFGMSWWSTRRRLITAVTVLRASSYPNPYMPSTCGGSPSPSSARWGRPRSRAGHAARLAVGAALVNLAHRRLRRVRLAPHGHFWAYTRRTLGRPACISAPPGLACTGVVLALATAAAPSRRRPVLPPRSSRRRRLLVVIARDNWAAASSSSLGPPDLCSWWLATVFGLAGAAARSGCDRRFGGSRLPSSFFTTAHLAWQLGLRSRVRS